MRVSLLAPILALVASQLTAQSPPAWRLVPEATFGATGDPAAEFSDIRGIEVSKNGDVLVLDYKTRNIRVFAPDGHLLRTIGRAGEGPGEFQQPNGFARSPDGKIWINDFANHRFSVHQDDGQYLNNVASTLTSFGYIWDAWFDGSGRMLNRVFARTPGTSVNDPMKGMIERRSMTSDQADTIPQITCTAGAIRSWSGRSEHSSAIMSVPFTPMQSVAYSPRDFAWCAPGDAYTVYRLGLVRRDTQVVIHGHVAPVPVTAAERDSAVANARAMFARSHVDAGAVSASDIPRNKPVVIGLALDDQSRLWVRLTPAATGHTHYDVYGANGRAIGAIDLAATLNEWPGILIRAEKLYAVVLDADDVPSVVRYRIEKTK